MIQNEQFSTALVAIDLSAAFDLVNHSILLERLDTYYGIRGTALEWFRSFLSGRTQRVVINGVYSKEKMLDHWVPQLKKIQLLQIEAARVITKTKRRDHIFPVLRDLHWPPIKKRTDYKMMALVLNAPNEQGPSCIADFFKLYRRRRSLRSESNTSLIPVHGRSIQINKRLLKCGVSTTWNSSPQRVEDNTIVYFIYMFMYYYYLPMSPRSSSVKASFMMC